MPVLIWQDAQTAIDLQLDEAHVHLVMERGAKIVHRSQGTDTAFPPAIDALLLAE